MHLLIAYFLSNISAKYYDNPTMLTRVIAKNVGMYFLRHSVCARTAPSFRHERSHHACFKHALKIWQSRSTLMVTARSTTIAIRSNCASTAYTRFRHARRTSAIGVCYGVTGVNVSTAKTLYDMAIIERFGDLKPGMAS